MNAGTSFLHCVFFMLYATDDAFKLTNGTSSLFLSPVTTKEVPASVNKTNICLRSNCPKNKICSADDQFSKGYRCCKSKNCSKDEGRFCEDPGEVENSNRLPNKTKRIHAFKFNKTVVYYCLTISLSSSSKFGYHISCQWNGSWKPAVPTCPSSITTTRVISTNTAKPQKTSTNSAVVTVMIIVTCCLFLLFISFIGWRKWKQDGSCSWTRRQSSTVIENIYHLPPLQQANLRVEAIPAEKFAQYVAIRHNNNNQRFLEEFEEIQNSTESTPLTCEASLMVENKEKNRYTNIVAYDHSRVHLHSYRGHRETNLHRNSDYINANYISSYSRPKAYIACQGPMPSTFNDFWRMIWENNTATIIMITNLLEKGRRKCDQYWPQEGKEQYKHIVVTLKATETFANFTIRTLSAKNMKQKRRNGRSGERRILQFHFTQWPDHGAPAYLLPVLTFIHRSSYANPLQAGPMVIHCSAGVGRTGTYIVIHSMMQMLQATGHVNIKDFMRHIRRERNHLVQTEDQYVFVHEAILEYILSGITEFSIPQLATYYENLIAPSYSDDGSARPDQGDVGSTMLRSGLERQFMKVVYSRTGYQDYDFATRSANASKNRPGAVLPLFHSRVLLCNITSAEGSDYINASFIQGYRDNHQFLVTQLPLPNTKKDFWQLVWDHNCPTLVTILDDEWNPDTDVYWPSLNKPLHCSSFNVSNSLESTSSNNGVCDIITRDFILEATKDDYVLEVKQYQLSNWNKEEPSLAQLDAVRAVVEFTSNKDGYTVIQDRYGSTAAMQFACWHFMQCQLDNESTVDVYQTVMVACQMRPRVLTSPLHLKFLYEAALLEGKARKNFTRSTNAADSPALEIETLNSIITYNDNGTSTQESPSCNSDEETETSCLVTTITA